MKNKILHFTFTLFLMFSSLLSYFRSEEETKEGEMLHYVFKTAIQSPEYSRYQKVSFGMGCFWGAERKFWQNAKVISTSVGYQGGKTQNPTYREVCSGQTGHAEVVHIIYDDKETTFQSLLDLFWGNHNPTQLNYQGNDKGTQYRTAIFYYNDEQRDMANASATSFQNSLTANGFGQIVTQIEDGRQNEFYLAEEYHQQYLAKNPDGYCGLKGTGCYNPSQINFVL